MKTTGIRVEVPENLYLQLSEIQEKRWKEKGTKTALSAIILEILQEKFSIEPPNCGNHDQDIELSGNVNATLRHINKEKKEMERKNNEFKILSRELLLRENKLDEREKSIIEREYQLLDRVNKNLELKSQIIDAKEQLNNKNTCNGISLKTLEESLMQQTQYLATLQNELKISKSEMLSLLKAIDAKTKDNILQDYIIPFLPALISAIGFIITNKNLKNIQPQQILGEKLNELLLKLKPEDRNPPKSNFLLF